MSTGFKIIQGGQPVDIEPFLVRKDLFQTDTCYTWGYNSYGQLGDGTRNSISTITANTIQNVRSMAMTDGSTLILKKDGSMWSCGYNTQGQLGLGDTLQRSSPVQIGSLTNWRVIGNTNSAFGAVKKDGTLWVWGNVDFIFGTNKSSPTQFGSLTDWADIRGAGQNFALKKTDGTLWLMGNGLGAPWFPAGAASSPIQMGSGQWKNAAMSDSGFFGIAADGTLWTRGLNTDGQLGLSDTTHRSVLTQVGSDTTWKEIDSAPNSPVLAIKEDGTLWSWGYNGFASFGGMLGTGESPSFKRSSPVQVGSLTNWKSISVGVYSMLAVKTDGTLWGCGYNGVFTPLATSVLSPIQLSSLSTWRNINNNYIQQCATRKD